MWFPVLRGPKIYCVFSLYLKTDADVENLFNKCLRHQRNVEANIELLDEVVNLFLCDLLFRWVKKIILECDLHLGVWRGGKLNVIRALIHIYTLAFMALTYLYYYIQIIIAIDL